MCDTHRASFCVTFAVLLSLCTPAIEAAGGGETVVTATSSAKLGVPEDAELFAAYQADRANQKVQTWGQFRGWVQTFYRGNLISDGWTRFSEVTVNTVKSPQARQAVIAQITELGKIISLEWAKDSSVRKITTTNLRRWNDMMATARECDDGSGQQIVLALREVRRMAERLR